MKRQIAMLAAGLWLAGCDSNAGGGAGRAQDPAAGRAAATAGTGGAANETAGLAACPFGKTSDWRGSITGGRLLVNGAVDLMMAGMKPSLTPRAAAPGTAAFDLALVPEPGAVVNARPRYEGPARGHLSRAEIYCGGKRIADIDLVLVVD